MAKIIPEKVMYFNTSYGEKQVYEALQKLSDEYTIFYSIQWQQRDRRNNIVWGESDFTIFHPKKGIIVIEVKSGKINCKDGKWYQTRLDNNETHEMNSPLDQANKSKYRFIELLKNIYGLGEKCAIQSMVWFPSIEDNNFDSLPPAYTKDIIFTRKELNSVDESLDKVYKYYNSENYTNISKFTSERIIKKLAPEFDLITYVGSEKDEKEYAFLRLTREQSTLLDYLVEQRKVTIQGPAGTGKTLIAIEEAKRLSLMNRKVLLLCFNHFLYEHLKTSINDINIECYNLNALLTKFTGRTNIDIINAEWYLNQIKEKLYYDDIIIDEGQDFSDSVINFFDNYVDEKEGKLYIFYDKNQLIYQRGAVTWIDKSECKLVLSKNCRNTFEIAITANNIIDLEIKFSENAIKGETPNLFVLNNLDELKIRLNNLINKYKKEGFLNKDIKILSLKSENESLLSGIEYIGDNRIVREIDNENILFTTSKKFKGMEGNVVIIVDINKSTIISEEDKRNFYVASSRAKQKLDLIINADEDELTEIADTLNDIKLSSSIAKIAMKLKVKPVLK